jgi:hypothetical protein
LENKAEGEPLKKQVKYENIKLANKRFSYLSISKPKCCRIESIELSLT